MTKLTRWRKPRQVTLPGGYKIPVVYWSARKIKHDPEVAATDLLGFWDGQKIVINSSEPLWRQIETFGHELVHAAHDYALWITQTYAEPIAQEAGETAAALADDVEDLFK